MTPTIYISRGCIWTDYDRLVGSKLALKLNMIGKDTRLVQHPMSFMDEIYSHSDSVVLANFLYGSDSLSIKQYLNDFDLTDKTTYELPYQYLPKTYIYTTKFTSKTISVAIGIVGCHLSAKYIAEPLKDTVNILMDMENAKKQYSLFEYDLGVKTSSIILATMSRLFSSEHFESFSKLLMQLDWQNEYEKVTYRNENKAYLKAIHMLPTVSVLKYEYNSAKYMERPILTRYTDYEFTKISCRIPLGNYIDTIYNIIQASHGLAIPFSLSMKGNESKDGYTIGNIFCIDTKNLREAIEIIKAIKQYAKVDKIAAAFKYNSSLDKNWLYTSTRAIAENP